MASARQQGHYVLGWNCERGVGSVPIGVKMNSQIINEFLNDIFRPWFM